MEPVPYVIGGLIAAVLVGAAAWVLGRALAQGRGSVHRHADAEALRGAVDQLLAQNRDAAARQHVALARELDAKKSLIDQQLALMRGELGKVGDLVQALERERATQLGELATALELQREHVAALTETTQGLREALSSSKARGQWGERMAEDVLALAGFLEGVNYLKQRAAGHGIPDFTFLLPDGLSLHMDVKFPLDNYLRFLDAASELEQRRARDDFLRDVRSHVKDLASRAYEADESTVDCVLLFIPNEALYAFIQQEDRTILDDALRQKLVFCSPLTLYAVLAVVRQAVDSFRVARTSSEILTRLSEFGRQWGKFVEKMGKLERSLDHARRDFDELVGTRRRMLDRELERIEDLRARGESTGEEDQPPLALQA